VDATGVRNAGFRNNHGKSVDFLPVNRSNLTGQIRAERQHHSGNHGNCDGLFHALTLPCVAGIVFQISDRPELYTGPARQHKENRAIFDENPA
jgi:hypothetical protein